MCIDRRDSVCGELRLPRPRFARARNDEILTGMSLAGLPLHNVSELKASRWGHHGLIRPNFLFLFYAILRHCKKLKRLSKIGEWGIIIHPGRRGR